MAIVSALAVASARVWWLVAYWTPRARTFRRRTRALELGVEWQRARECPAEDAWRQQVELDIGMSAVTVPMTAELLADAVDRGVPNSRRWRRRHQRAIARARSGAVVSEMLPVSRAVVGRRRRIVARVVPVAAAMALGLVLSPTFQDSGLHSHPAGGQIGGFRYECSQCKPEAAHAAAELDYARRIQIFADPTVPPSVSTAQLRRWQLRNATRQNPGSR